MDFNRRAMNTTTSTLTLLDEHAGIVCGRCIVMVRGRAKYSKRAKWRTGTGIGKRYYCDDCLPKKYHKERQDIIATKGDRE